MKKNNYKNIFAKLFLGISLILNFFTPLSIHANEEIGINSERALPQELVNYTYTHNIAVSGAQSFKVTITCLKIYTGAGSIIHYYTFEGNCSLSSVKGGTARISSEGEGTESFTPDRVHSSPYVVNIGVTYTPTSGSTKRYLVKFYFVNGVLYDRACESL